MRAFRCIPISILHSPAVINLTSFERDCYYSGIVAQDDRHSLPWDTHLLKSIIFPGRHFVGTAQLAAARDKLVALGVWIHKHTPRKDWLEIHPDYRHAQGATEATYADLPAAGAQQQEFPIGLHVVPQHRRGRKNQRVESRAEENRTEVPPPTAPAHEEAGDSLTEAQAMAQAQNAGIPPDFARHVWADWESRGGRDGAGILVAYIRLAAKRWARERSEWEAGTHKAKHEHHPPNDPQALRARIRERCYAEPPREIRSL